MEKRRADPDAQDPALEIEERVQNRHPVLAGSPQLQEKVLPFQRPRNDTGGARPHEHEGQKED